MQDTRKSLFVGLQKTSFFIIIPLTKNTYKQFLALEMVEFHTYRLLQIYKNIRSTMKCITHLSKVFQYNIPYISKLELSIILCSNLFFIRRCRIYILNYLKSLPSLHSSAAKSISALIECSA